MDEPASALDPIATSKIEELVVDFENAFTTIMIVYNAFSNRRPALRSSMWRWISARRLVHQDYLRPIASARAMQSLAAGAGGLSADDL